MSEEGERERCRVECVHCRLCVHYVRKERGSGNIFCVSHFIAMRDDSFVYPLS